MRKLFFIILLFIQGCTLNTRYSIKEYADRTVEIAYYKNLIKAESYPSASKCVEEWRLERIKREYNLPNGNFVHVYPEKCGCLIHWEIDKKTHKIVGYKFEGDGCPK